MIDVEELRRLLASATSGEWYVEESDGWWGLYAENAHPEFASPLNPHGLAHPLKIAKCAKRDQPYAEYWPNPADSALIVALRNAAVPILDEVERLRKREAELVEALQLLNRCEAMGKVSESVRAVVRAALESEPR